MKRKYPIKKRLVSNLKLIAIYENPFTGFILYYFMKSPFTVTYLLKKTSFIRF